ncbi:MAG: hypothetical protein ACI9UN_001137 [Granulosicoccus sp.]|jgi:hypothetical protein
MIENQIILENGMFRSCIAAGKKGVFVLGAGVGTAALAKQRYDTYASLCSGDISVTDAVSQNAKGARDFGIGFTPLPVRVLAGGSYVGLAEKGDRSQEALNQAAGTVCPIDIEAVARVLDTNEDVKDKVKMPLMKYAHDQGITHATSAGQVIAALIHKEVVGNPSVLDVLADLAINHPSTKL